jgi:hypothetical protein
MSPLVLAHFGHWYASMLYVAPVVIVVGFLWVQTRRERRHGDEEAEPED